MAALHEVAPLLGKEGPSLACDECQRKVRMEATSQQMVPAGKCRK